MSSWWSAESPGIGTASDPEDRDESLDALLAQLVDGCALWDEYRDYYIKRFIPELQSGKCEATSEEMALIARIQNVVTEEQWASLPEIVDAYAMQREDERIAALEVQKGAARAAQDAAAARKAEELRRLEARRAAEALAVERERRRIEFEEEQRRQAQANTRKKDEIEIALLAALQESLVKADELSSQVNTEGLVDYSALKARYVSEWLKSRLGTDKISREQVDAIGEMAPAFLLKARAGSGKTSVITAKTMLLMEQENVSPDHVTILAFNKKAAEEVRSRIRRKYGLVAFDNARTFHSLAYQLVQPKGELLFDETGGSVNLRKQSVLVQRLLNAVMNPALLAEIYLFFRQELEELEDIGAFLSSEDYYVYRRNQIQETLGGQSVKSTGEKWLADFLFEHGIRYVYERLWFWGGQNYRPDFSLTTDGPAPNIVIEHWGIDLNDPTRTVPAHWNRSWEDYRQEIDGKRAYWQSYNKANPTRSVLFLETSVSDLRGGREVFEGRLGLLLAPAGVKIERRSDEELREAIVTSRIGRFSTMCLQYIQKAKKQRLSPEAMSRKISGASGLGIKTTSFLHIANNLYRRYQRALADENRIDFDDLLSAAIDRIHQTKGRCQIRIADDRFVAMNDLRWVMIDEYQDFSPLYFDLIHAIRSYNRKANLFCVGDDWQAINAFAGSDLRFFHKFSDLMKGADTGYLRNNYRSDRPIVELANRFMQGKGQTSNPTITVNRGRVELCHTDKVWIELRSGEEFADDRIQDERFQTFMTFQGERRQLDTGMRIGRMLKQCHTIVTNPRYAANANTTFAILSRVEQLGAGYRSLADFQAKLKATLLPEERKLFVDFDARVRCGTVHSFKGLEADVVIVLGVNKRNFPKIHPDNKLYEILGVTPGNVLLEEERLFYVALTRTRSDLFLLTETGRESEFLTRLGLLNAEGSGTNARPSIETALHGIDIRSELDDDIPFL